MNNCGQMGYLSLQYLTKRAKAALRRFVPAHVRFVRAGKSFLIDGEREVHLLSTLVTPGSVAIDVGANVGDYTYSLCRAVGPGGRVIAIEPLPDLAQVLTRAARKLALPLTVINCALSSQQGEAELRVPKSDGLRQPGFATLVPRISGGDVVRVELRRLDDVCQAIEGKISFIKIDVEGHELDVLRGGERAIKQHRPNLLVEIEQRHSPTPIAQTFDYILSLGYRGEFVEEEGTLRPIETFDIQTHQTGRLGKRSYISNFIFRPK